MKAIFASWVCLMQALHAASHINVSVSDSSLTTCDRMSQDVILPQAGGCTPASSEDATQKNQNISRSLLLESNHVITPNASNACASHLRYLMTHHANFLKQSSNVVDNLEVYLGRLRDVWPESFDQCLSVRISDQSAGSKGVVTHGQYCLAYFLPPTVDQMSEDERNLFEGKREASRYPTPILQSGLCVPESCSTTDVEELLKHLLKDVASRYTIFVPQDQCQTDKPKPVPLVTKLVGAGVFIIVSMVIVGTIVEILEFKKKSNSSAQKEKVETKRLSIQKEESLLRSVVRCFSLFSNAWFLFKMDTVTPGEIEAFNGVRFLVAVGCQMIHLMMLANFNGWSNANESPFLWSISTLGFFHIQLLLQVAVMVSGASITISTLHRIQVKDKGFNLISFYLRRIWRLSIPYYIMVALVAGLVPYLISGPKWPDVDHQATNCRKMWWANILFINNYFNDPVCQFHTWYLSADVQLVLIAPLFILAFNRSARLGLATAAIFSSYSVGRLFYNAYFYSLNPLGVSTQPLVSKTMIYFRNLYFLPYSRIGCYCAGITMGYLIHTYGKTFKIKQSVRFWAPTAATLFIFSPAWLWYRFENETFQAPTQLEAALYEAFSRILFSSSTAYIGVSIYAGYQDIPTRFFRALLCQKFFVFTSKLHYSVFLLHVIVIQCFLGSRPQPMEFSSNQLYKVSFGLLVLTHLLAIPFTLLAVFPFARLEKVLEQRLKRNKVEEEIKLSKLN